jgi:hypothetical protein
MEVEKNFFIHPCIKEHQNKKNEGAYDVRWCAWYTEFAMHRLGSIVIIIQHLFLLVLGVTIGLGVLEVTLRAVAHVYSENESKTSLAPADSNHIRIVALGESTTASLGGVPAWPEFLESELNRQVGGERFRVYNLGVPGSNSQAIEKRVYEDVLAFKPDIVITMIGINDAKYIVAPSGRSTAWESWHDWIGQLRLYKLASTFSFFYFHDYSWELLSQALQCNADELVGDRAWTYTYFPAYQEYMSGSQKDEAKEQLLLEFMEKFPLSYQAYEPIIEYYFQKNQPQKAYEWASRATAHEPLIRLCIGSNRALEKEGKRVVIEHLADVMTKMRSIQANDTWESREAVEYPQRINVNTIPPYRNIASYLSNHEIKHISMQYPLLSVDPLKEILGDISNVRVLSNEENFHTLLKTHPYEDVFIDRFGGVFGHTTPLGSMAIASQAATAVLEIISQKETPLH